MGENRRGGKAREGGHFGDVLPSIVLKQLKQTQTQATKRLGSELELATETFTRAFLQHFRFRTLRYYL